MKKFLWFLFALVAISGSAVALVMQPVLFTTKAPSLPAVSEVELKTHVRALSEQFHPRSHDHKENLEAAAQYIEVHFAGAGARVTSQAFAVENYTYRNIIASYGPEGGPIIVVGAHYDSFGTSEEEHPLYTPGADDNASGVAGLLALAKILRKHPPKQRVQLVAYALEEPPFFATDHMGSAAHTARLRKEGENVTAMLSLEMIGRFSDEEGSQTFPLDAMGLFYPRKGNFISVVGRLWDIPLTRAVKKAMIPATDLPVWSISALPLVPGIAFSDHRNFWRHGFPAVMITDTAFYRNADYHTLKDTANRLDYRRMAKVVQGVYAALVALQ